MDIAMCLGTNCPLKEDCLRFKGERNPYSQSYFAQVPFENGKCEFYWKITPETPVTEEEEWDEFRNAMVKAFVILTEKTKKDEENREISDN
jgi:hypothetical protein